MLCCEADGGQSSVGRFKRERRQFLPIACGRNCRAAFLLLGRADEPTEDSTRGFGSSCVDAESYRSSPNRMATWHDPWHDTCVASQLLGELRKLGYHGNKKRIVGQRESGMFQSTTIPLLQQVVNFAQARHGVLVGNVANLDTPGYRVRDLSVETFQERLREALQTSRDRHEPVSAGMLTKGPDDPLRDVGDSLKSILYHDDSNVGIEQQVLEISKNQYLHNLAISIMGNQFRLLEAAVTERV